MTDLTPDTDAMLAHVVRLHGAYMDKALIEVAWTGPDEDDPNVRSGKLFDSGDFEGIVQHAKNINQTKGQNVYVCAALRKPDADTEKRASGQDVLALPALYADFDDPGRAEAAAEKTKNFPPSMIVTTGAVPHLRQQYWWKLDEPLLDFSQSSSLLKRMAEALGGDLHVHDAPRVMRLAGTVAWPKKPGRVPELTRFEDRHSEPYPIELFERLFPAATSVTPPLQSASDLNKRTSSLNLPDRPGSWILDCLKDLHRPGMWHQSVLRLTGRWVGKSLANEEIALLAYALTQRGYSVEQTLREMGVMVEGARKNLNISNETALHDDQNPASSFRFSLIDDLNVNLIPQREWVLGRSLIKKYLSVLVAPPGVGKSTLSIAQALAIITGEPLTGQEVHRPGKVWIYNNEDDYDEMRRRLGAVLQHYKIKWPDVRGQLALNSGADHQLLLAKPLSDGTVIQLPDVEACIEYIQKNDITAFFVDPFIETHQCEENSNPQIKAVGQMYREIARRGKCAVGLSHHTVKPQQGSSEGHAGNMNTARGASSLIGVARVIETLFSASKKDAEQYGIKEDERHLYVRLDDAKANLSLASPEARWFIRRSVVIGNEDEVGVLEPIEMTGTAMPAKTDDDFNHTIIATLLALFEKETTTLNTAAIELSWYGGKRFEEYRQTDKRGNKRASRTLRTKIEDACKANITIVTGAQACGFTIKYPEKGAITLHRFSRPAVSSEIAAQPPEFLDPETTEDDHDS